MGSGPRSAEEFVREITEVVLGLKRMLYTADLTSKCYLLLHDDGHGLQIPQDYTNSEGLAVEAVSTVRDLIQRCFALLGIEVEFCGKGENEKGVIIDYDISLLNTFGIDVDTIKLGQTVVKIDESRDPLYKYSINRIMLSDIELNDNSLEEWLTALLFRDLNDLRNT